MKTTPFQCFFVTRGGGLIWRRIIRFRYYFHYNNCLGPKNHYPANLITFFWIQAWPSLLLLPPLPPCQYNIQFSSKTSFWIANQKFSRMTVITPEPETVFPSSKQKQKFSKVIVRWVVTNYLEIFNLSPNPRPLTCTSTSSRYQRCRERGGQL